MKFSIFSILAIFFCVASTFLSAQGEISDSSTGEVFPKDVSFEHDGKQFHLQATGVATRKKFFVKIYSVAHYLQDGAQKSGGDILQIIMQDDNAKQLTLKWVRNIEAEKVKEGYHDSFKGALSELEFTQLQNEINQYLLFFNTNIQKGDEHILRWLPGGYVEVLINGNQVGNITNKDFAKALWSIWFGAKSVVDRNNLISLAK